MHKPYRKKTSFIIPQGLYCYKVMTFELKNDGVIYQRMITKMFGYLMGSTMDTYVDDMLVKKNEKWDHLKDLVKVFEILKEHKLKLDTTECVLGLSSGKFMGNLVTQLGIEAKPKQIMANNDL